MTNAEAVQALKDIVTQTSKVSDEVKKLIALVQGSGDVSQELADQITAVQSAIQGVDDLNPDNA